MLANIWFIYHSNFEFHSSRSSAAGCAVTFEGNRMDRKKKRGQQTNSILLLVPLLWTFNFFLSFFLFLLYVFIRLILYPYTLTFNKFLSFSFFHRMICIIITHAPLTDGRPQRQRSVDEIRTLFFSGKVSSSPPIDGTIKEKCTKIQFAELKFNEAKQKKNRRQKLEIDKLFFSSLRDRRRSDDIMAWKIWKKERHWGWNAKS